MAIINTYGLVLKSGRCIAQMFAYHIDWLINGMVFNADFNSISVISRGAVHLSMLSWSSLTSTPHDILSKLLAAFPHNHETTDSGERGINPVTMTHQSSERILAEPGIEAATSCSQVRNATD